MHIKGRVITWAVAATAVAALVTAGSVYASAGPATTERVARTSAELRAILVPTNEHPTGSKVLEEGITTAQAVDEGLLVPTGMTFVPASCINYFDTAVGGLGTRAGWIQYGTRPDVPTHHNDFFGHTVATVPGGVSMSTLRAGVGSCRAGTVTLDGAITGAIMYQDIAAPVLDGAATFAVKATVLFPKATTPEGAAALKKYGYEEETQCDTTVIYVGMDDLIIEIMEPSQAYAEQMAIAMHARAQAQAPVSS